MEAQWHIPLSNLEGLGEGHVMLLITLPLPPWRSSPTVFVACSLSQPLTCGVPADTLPALFLFSHYMLMAVNARCMLINPRDMPPVLSFLLSSWPRDLLGFSFCLLCGHLKPNCSPHSLSQRVRPLLTPHPTSNPGKKMVAAINFSATWNSNPRDPINFISEINLHPHSSPILAHDNYLSCFRFLSIQSDYWDIFLGNLFILPSSIHSIHCYNNMTEQQKNRKKNSAGNTLRLYLFPILFKKTMNHDADDVHSHLLAGLLPKSFLSHFK